MTINPTLKDLINQILKKKVDPTRIYKSYLEDSQMFTIEVETSEPINHISVLYKKEVDRDKDFILFDERVFESLKFNPYNDMNVDM